MISLVKNLKCISRLNIHYYPNRRYKSYITSLKAVIAGKSLISAGLDIDRILHFVFYDKILQIYRQHWVRKFYQHILSKYRQISKKWGVGSGWVGGGHPPCSARPWMHLMPLHWLFSELLWDETEEFIGNGVVNAKLLNLFHLIQIPSFSLDF